MSADPNMSEEDRMAAEWAAALEESKPAAAAAPVAGIGSDRSS